MSNVTDLVVNDAANKQHVPIAAGDKIAGSLIQLSTDAGNGIVVGSDGGLKVSSVAGLPDDQTLTGDNSGSVNFTLTPTTDSNGDVNYTIKGDVKVSPAADNVATVTSAGIYVPAPTASNTAPVTGNAPAVINNGTTTTQYFGGNDIALGNPLGWRKFAGSTEVFPVYNEGALSDGAPAEIGKKVLFGEEASNTSSYQTHPITFSTPFTSKPFVTVASEIQGDLLQWRAVNVGVNGFMLVGYGTSDNATSGTVSWKAEEK